MIRTYEELVKMASFEDRFNYLKLDGKVGNDTFGFDRYLNQRFYRSSEWRRVRREIIIRDDGYDLGIRDRPIVGRVYIHHMNPISSDDIIHSSDFLLNPNYLISVSLDTHNALHYGDISLIEHKVVERKPNDTCPWRS